MFPFADAQRIALRRPCICGERQGYVKRVSGQATVYCTNCDNYQGYNATRSETDDGGEHPDRENGTTSRAYTLPVSQRHRILQRDGFRCRTCGADQAQTTLHVGHILSVSDGLTAGFSELELARDFNLLTECEACNLGHAEHSLPFPLLVRLYRVFMTAEDRRGFEPEPAPPVGRPKRSTEPS